MKARGGSGTTTRRRTYGFKKGPNDTYAVHVGELRARRREALLGVLDRTASPTPIRRTRNGRATASIYFIR